MFFPIRGDSLSKNSDAFKNELLQTPGISSVSIGYEFPGDAVAGDEVIIPQHGQNVTQSATQLAVDYDYINTLQLTLVAGRDFSKEMGTDKDHAWIINETAVKSFGFGTPEKALGQTLYWHPWDGNNWSQFAPDYPIDYTFLDQNFAQMYRAEDKLESLLWIFTGIAIFVGCLGLFGLATYTAETRRKEVGIRKILGASTKGIVLLLSKDFISPVVLSLLVASPIGWYFMNQWLQGFAYRVSLAWWMFLIAGLTSIVIAWVTAGYQSIRAARANPVKNLRIE